MKQEYLMTYLEGERNEADERVRILQQKHEWEMWCLEEKLRAFQVYAFCSTSTIVVMYFIPDGLISKIFNAIMKVIYE